MFARAIICTDLSPSSDSIVACAGSLGVLGVREAVLTHIVDVGESASASARRDVDAMFGRQARELEAAGIQVRVDTSVGYPSYEIEEVARRNHAELIVIGSHRKGLFATTFSGSVSSDVARISSRPVLLAVLAALGSEEQSHDVCRRLLQHVLAPLDLAEGTPAVEDYLLAMAGKGLACVDLLHVVDNQAENAAENRRCHALSEMERIAHALTEEGVRVNSDVVIGAPDRETAARAADGEHTMVVLSPRPGTDPDLPLGSVTHAVVQATTAPVLLIPPACRRRDR